MEDLIKALQIFLKYKNEKWPTQCTHDELSVVGITKHEVSPEDQKALEELGFDWNEHDEYWYSFRYGSA